MSKRPFALTEVCVALAVIGVCISYIFSSLNQTIQRYSALQQEIMCQELADEHAAQLIATFLTSPPEYDTAVEGGETSLTKGNYEIYMSTAGSETEDESDDQEKVGKKKASLITLIVAVHPVGNDQICAVRNTTLCVTQEGNT
jgi:hypothetical protein